MANNRKNSKKTKILLVCGVLLLASVSASWAISGKVLNNHECFVSITAREMLTSGDWVWPTCNGQPRLVKTPLSYWLVAGSAKLTGSVDELTARLPSIIFAVLSVAAILYFVNRCASFRTAVICAAVWATSLGYIRYAHNARPEMVMTFFIVLAFLSFYCAVTAQSRKRQVAYTLVFWLSFALANLAKGPAPLPLVLLPLFFYIAIFRKWRTLPKLLPIIGPLIFLAIVLPWPLAIAHKLNWDLGLWKTEFVDRFLGNYRPGSKSLYYYLLRMFSFVVPWVVFLPMALAGPFYRVWNKKRPLMQFLWLWFVVDIAFLTISGGKRQHYIFPLMPAMAVLIGILIEDMAFTRKAYSLRFAKTTLLSHVIGGIALAVAGYVYIVKACPDMVTEAVILSTAIVILAAIVAVLFAAGKAAAGCGTFFAGIVVLVMIGYVAFLNPLNYNRHSRNFSKRLAQIVPQSDDLIAYEHISNRSVHYFGRVIPKIYDNSVLYNCYKEGDWVVATADHLDRLLMDGRLKMVYYKQKAERGGQQDTHGALFHRSAPFVTAEP